MGNLTSWVNGRIRRPQKMSQLDMGGSTWRRMQAIEYFPGHHCINRYMPSFGKTDYSSSRIWILLVLITHEPPLSVVAKSSKFDKSSNHFLGHSQLRGNTVLSAQLLFVKLPEAKLHRHCEVRTGMKRRTMSIVLDQQWSVVRLDQSAAIPSACRRRGNIRFHIHSRSTGLFRRYVYSFNHLLSSTSTPLPLVVFN